MSEGGENHGKPRLAFIAVGCHKNLQHVLENDKKCALALAGRLVLNDQNITIIEGKKAQTFLSTLKDWVQRVQNAKGIGYLILIGHGDQGTATRANEAGQFMLQDEGVAGTLIGGALRGEGTRVVQHTAEFYVWNFCCHGMSLGNGIAKSSAPTTYNPNLLFNVVYPSFGFSLLTVGNAGSNPSEEYVEQILQNIRNCLQNIDDEQQRERLLNSAKAPLEPHGHGLTFIHPLFDVHEDLLHFLLFGYKQKDVGGIAGAVILDSLDEEGKISTLRDLGFFNSQSQDLEKLLLEHLESYECARTIRQP